MCLVFFSILIRCWCHSKAQGGCIVRNGRGKTHKCTNDSKQVQPKTKKKHSAFMWSIYEWSRAFLVFGRTRTSCFISRTSFRMIRFTSSDQFCGVFFYLISWGGGERGSFCWVQLWIKERYASDVHQLFNTRNFLLRLSSLKRPDHTCDVLGRWQTERSRGTKGMEGKCRQPHAHNCPQWFFHCTPFSPLFMSM